MATKSSKSKSSKRGIKDLAVSRKSATKVKAGAARTNKRSLS